MSGNLETKYQVKDLGVTLTEKWTTDNSLSTTVDVVDKLVPGLKLTLDTKFAPGTGAKSGKQFLLSLYIKRGCASVRV